MLNKDEYQKSVQLKYRYVSDLRKLDFGSGHTAYRRVTHWPLSTYQISLKLEKLLEDVWMGEQTLRPALLGRLEEVDMLTRRSRPENWTHGCIYFDDVGHVQRDVKRMVDGQRSSQRKTSHVRHLQLLKPQWQVHLRCLPTLHTYRPPHTQWKNCERY